MLRTFLSLLATLGPRRLAIIAAVLLFAWALWLWQLWQPENQVALHQRDFIAALEARKWRAIRRLMADDYRDRWGHDKAIVLEHAPRAFGQFLALQITQTPPEPVPTPNGEVRVRLRFDGNGGPAAEYAKQAVNLLAEPFVFRWEKKSWRPWDWQLVNVEQPELEIPRWEF